MSDLNYADLDCFSFYIGGASCERCVANKRCKAILATNGIDIVASVVNHLLTELPPARFRDTDRVPELVDQLLEPPSPLTLEEAELLKLANQSGVLQPEEINIDTV